MPNRKKLLKKISNNPSGVRFDDICKLVKLYGYELSRIKGSHHIYKRTGVIGILTLQPGENGKAKEYQVNQVLDAIEEMGEID